MAFWATRAAGYLEPLLAAAMLTGQGAGAVAGWIARDATAEAEDILRAHGLDDAGRPARRASHRASPRRRIDQGHDDGRACTPGPAVVTAPTAPAAAPAAPACDVRLATRISEPVDRRLRLAALVRRMSLSQFLDQLLDQALPPVGELAEQIQGSTRNEC